MSKQGDFHQGCSSAATSSATGTQRKGHSHYGESSHRKGRWEGREGRSHAGEWGWGGTCILPFSPLRHCDDLLLPPHSSENTHCIQTDAPAYIQHCISVTILFTLSLLQFLFLSIHRCFQFLSLFAPQTLPVSRLPHSSLTL